MLKFGENERISFPDACLEEGMRAFEPQNGRGGTIFFPDFEHQAGLLGFPSNHVIAVFNIHGLDLHHFADGRSTFVARTRLWMESSLQMARGGADYREQSP
jgi:hypothetical protein